jgi:ABC-type glycerol-3-phosphate transport system substrate-binding protein
MKKFKLHKVFAAAMAATMMLAACGQQSGSTEKESEAGGTSTKASEQAGSEASGNSELEPMTLEVYSQPANFQGNQIG